MSEDDQNCKKLRGRRKIEDDQYYAMTNDKIQEWEYILQNSKNLSKKEKKILRNRISAQKSRNKKKEEFGQLNNKIDQLKDRYKQLFEILDEQMCDACKSNVIASMEGQGLKRQKLQEMPKGVLNTQASSKVNGFLKIMMSFVAMAAVICVAVNPFETTSNDMKFLSNDFSQEYSSTSDVSRRLASVEDQKY